MSSPSAARGPEPERPAVVVLSQSEWGLAWVFAHDVALHFARQGHPVVFLDPFPKRFPRPREWRRIVGRLFARSAVAGFAAQPRPAGIRFVTPLTLPDRCRLFTWINRRLLLPGLRRRVLAACAERRQRIVFACQPFATPLALAAMLSPSRLVYARRDGYEDDPRLAGLRMAVGELEAHADLIVASGRVLAAKSPSGAKVVDIPGLVDFAAFFRPVAPRPAWRRPPVCCYFGHVNERVDMAILQRVARQYPLRVIGRVSIRWPAGIQAEQVGVVANEQVAGLLAGCDVVVIPYRLGGFFANIFPYKIFQAFAQGLPVVATPMPALAHLHGLVYLAADPEEFVAQIACAAGEGAAVKLRRQELARRYDREPQLEALRRRLLDAGEGE